MYNRFTLFSKILLSILKLRSNSITNLINEYERYDKKIISLEQLNKKGNRTLLMTTAHSFTVYMREFSNQQKKKKKQTKETEQTSSFHIFYHYHIFELALFHLFQIHEQN